MKYLKSFNESVKDMMTPKPIDEIRKSLKNLSSEEKLKTGCIKGLIWLVKDALDEGVDVHWDNDHALAFASGNGHIEIVKLLLSVGADANRVLNRNNHDLLWAIDRHKEIKKLLKQYSKKKVNESVKDMMTPKSTEDIKKVIEKLPPYKALATAYKYELPELIKLGWDRVKPINDKLYQDTKKFKKNNIDGFMDFICSWLDKQGGKSYEVQEVFGSISEKMGAIMEEEYDDGDEEMDEFEHPLPTGQKTVDSIYSDNTIKSYKQLVINYVIDELSHNIWDKEEEDWEEEYDEDDEETNEVEDDGNEYEEDAARQTREQKIKLENERLEKEEKEKEEKKLRNKIKNFLGFNKKED